MRGTWIDAGSDPTYSVLDAHGITQVCFDIRDPRVTKQYLRNVLAEPEIEAVGVYAAWNWQTWWPRPYRHPAFTGVQFAEWVAAKVKPLHMSQDVPFVHLNIETHDVDWILAALTRWRRARARKRTLWTLEGFQGGLFGHADVSEIEALDLEYGPQCYTGSMVRFESAAVVDDFVRHGFSPERIYPFLDGSQMGWEWRGWAFTQGRLPR